MDVKFPDIFDARQVKQLLLANSPTPMIGSEGMASIYRDRETPLEMCRRYLEGVLRQEIKENFDDGSGNPQFSTIALMTHRPSIVTRLGGHPFDPPLGDVHLPAPSRFAMPSVNRGGYRWINAAPMPLQPRCQNQLPQPIHWNSRPGALPVSNGDFDKYWPSYRN